MTVLVCLIFLLAGMVKGVVGLGLPTLAMALLGLLMPPMQAGLLLLTPALVTNAWQLLHGGALRRLLRRLWPMLVGICIGTWAGLACFGSSGRGATIALGLVLTAYGIHGLKARPWSVPSAREGWWGLLAGVTTGMLSAPTAVFVIPLAPYLQGLALPKGELVQALGLALTVSTLALAAGRATELGAGLSAGEWLLPTASALVGMWLGRRVRARLDPLLFRRCFFGSLVALGGLIAGREL